MREWGTWVYRTVSAGKPVEVTHGHSCTMPFRTPGAALGAEIHLHVWRRSFARGAVCIQPSQGHFFTS